MAKFSWSASIEERELAALAELHLEALSQDASQRPRFRLFRTVAANSWLIGTDVAPDDRSALEALARAEPVVRDFELNSPNIEGYRAILERSAPVEREYRGPAFVFPEQFPEAPRAVVLTSPDPAVLEAHFDWAMEEWTDIQPVAVAIEDGVAVSICHSPAISARAAEAGVETLEAARGRGYAVEVVAAWARALRDAGRVPMYSTTWDNAASRRVAEKLALTMYGEDFHLT